MKKFKKVFAVIMLVWYILVITVTTVFGFSHVNNLQTIDESVSRNSNVESEVTPDSSEITITPTEEVAEETTTVPVGTESTPVTEEVTSELSIEDAVANVLKGNYGNGEERITNLTNLGFTSEEIKQIQKLVNENCATQLTSSPIAKEQDTTSVSVETENTAVNNSTETNSTEITSNTESTNSNYLGNFKITGYSQEEGFVVGECTASGIGCKPGICAMNNQRRKELGINYGDTIYVEELGNYTVADCGCSYNTIDIWVYTNAEAYSLTSHKNVYLVK